MFGKNKVAKEKQDIEIDDQDDLGPYPTDVDSNPTQQRVLERSLRMVTVGLGVSAASNVAFVALIIAMLPLKQVYPYLVTFKDSDEQVVAIEPISKDAPGIQYATEANVRQYVKLRHTFSPVESFMESQWGEASQLAVMTDAQEYGEFKSAAENEKTQMLTRNLSRSINVESATMIRPDTWQVNFTTTETPGGNNGTLTAGDLPIPSQNANTSFAGTSPTAPSASSSPSPLINISPPKVTKKWLATMTIAYQPERVSYDQRLLNPLGFTVTDYSVIERN